MLPCPAPADRSGAHGSTPHRPTPPGPHRSLARPTAGALEVDGPLLDATVVTLNRLYVAGGLQTARALVRVLVDTFWNGSLERALTGTDRHATFLALRSRGDLHVSYSVLVRMLRVVALLDQLTGPAGSAETLLSFSHLSELLKLNDTTLTQPLADRTVAERWSVRDLRAAIREANGEVVAPAGPLRTLHAGLKRSTRVVEKALDDAKALIDDPAERAAAPDVVSDLDALMARYAELRVILVQGRPNSTQ